MCILLPSNTLGRIHAALISRKDAVIALSLYAVLISIIYSPVVFARKSQIPSLYQPHGVMAQGAYKQKGRVPQNTFNADIATGAYYEFPVNKLVGDMYKNGELPLWNPYQASGTPLAAQYSTRAFFPYQILEDISPVAAWDFFLLGRLLMAGFFTYLFLRAAGLGCWSAFAGGVFYMFSGAFTWFISLEQMVNVAMMLPVVLYTVERLSRTGISFKNSSREIAVSGIAFALLLLAGQPEAALYASSLAAAFFLFRIISLYTIRNIFKASLKLVSSYFIGLGLCAPLLFIFLELVSLSYHIHPAGGQMGIQSLANWKSIFAALTPGVTEFPSDPEMILGVSLLVQLGDGFFYRFMPINGVWDALGGYTGILPVLLIMVGFITSFSNRGFGKRGMLYFFAFFGGAIILKNLGVRPFIWLGYIPLFDQVWSLRWAGPAWVFSLSAAAAVSIESIEFFTVKGMDRVTRVTEGSGLSRLKSAAEGYFNAKPYMAFCIPFALLLGIYILIPFFPTVIMTIKKDELFNLNMRPFVLPSMFSGSLVTIITLISAFLMLLFSRGDGRKAVYGIIPLGVLELWWAVPRGYDALWLFYKWIPFFAGFTAVLLFYTARWRSAVAFTVLFFATFLTLDTLSPMGLPLRQDPFRPAPYVEYLRKQDGQFRAAGLDGVLFPNFACALRINDVRYVNSLLASTYQNYRTRYLHADTFDEGPASALWFTGRPERCALTRGESGTTEARYRFFSRPAEEDIIKRLRNYSLLGVKYFIIPNGFFSGVDSSGRYFNAYNGNYREGLRPVYDKEVKVFENTAAIERAFVVYDYEYADSYENAQKMAFEDNESDKDAQGSRDGKRFDLKRRAVLEERLGNTVQKEPKGEGHYKAAIIEYRPNRVIVDVSTDRDGLLVLTDVYYPGWSVTVNNKDAKLLRVDGLVRGVEVKDGRSIVVFKYLPLSFKAGLAVSILTAIVCVVLLFNGSSFKTVK